MSRWWPERYELLVHPQAARLSGGGSTASLPVESAASADAPPWHAAVDTALALAAARSGRGSRVDVVVADHFVRYAVLPWSTALIGRARREEAARALLRASCGAEEAALQVALDAPRFGRNAAIAGVPREMIALLRSGLRDARLRAASLRPRALHELARHRARIADGDGWFCHADTDRFVLGGLASGNLVSLRNQRGETADAARLSRELSGLIAVSAPLDGRRLYFFGAAGAAPTLPSLDTVALAHEERR